MTYIEDKANAFGEGHQEKIINILIKEIDKNLETPLETIIANENKRLAEKHKGFMESLPEDEKENYKDSKPETVTFKSPAEKFQFAFQELLKEEKTLMHDIDAKGQLIIKFFKLIGQESYQFKTTYKIELN